MEAVTVSNLISSTADNIKAVLDIALDELNTLITNPVILVFFSFSVMMLGFHVIHSARKMF